MLSGVLQSYNWVAGLDGEKETISNGFSYVLMLMLIRYWLGWRRWRAPATNQACDMAVRDFPHHLFPSPPQSAEGRTRTW